MTTKNMMRHNLSAVEKVKQSLLTKDRAAVVHATGTGKSYIISEIAKDYERVLIVVPNNYIRQQLERHNINAKYTTYSYLKNHPFSDEKLDLIVLDEFHHAGAPTWEKSINELIEANPNAKIFGTTATEIRYLDSGRDMSKELFNGNVVSRLNLVNAWAQGILPVPTYISSLYSINKIYDKKKKQINRRKLSENKYMEACSILEQGRLEWEKSDGVANVFRKHLSSKTKSIIVFCKLGENLPEFINLFRSWMKGAGFNVVHYLVNYQNPESLKEIERFRKEKYVPGTIKVVFSINMLNEGIHVPDVDCVMFFRGTISKNIFLQQLGRCMSVEYTGSPLVFDFMDNISSTDFIADYKSKFEIKNTTNERNIRRVEDFKVIDYVRNIKEVISRLNEVLQVAPLEERLLELKKRIEQNGWPKKGTVDYNLIRSHPNHPLIKEIKDKYHIASPYQNRFSNIFPKVVIYLEQNGWPKKGELYYEFIHTHRKRPEIQELYRKYKKPYRKIQTFESRLVDITNYVIKFGWPKKGTSEFFFIQHNKKRSEIIRLKEEYEKKEMTRPVVRSKTSFQKITEYLLLYGWPKPTTKEYQYIYNHRHVPNVAALIAKHKENEANGRVQKNYSRISKYLTNNGWPKPKSKEYNFIQNHRHEPKIKLLIEKYRPKNKRYNP